MQSLIQKKKKILQKQLRYKIKFKFETILDSRIK